MSEPFLPTEEDLRDRVDTVAVKSGRNGVSCMHVASMEFAGSEVRPFCGSASQNGKPWKPRSPGVFPTHPWCKDCAFKLFNRRLPNNEERGLLEGPAYE